MISSGPYMFDGNFNPTTGFTLVRNPNWDAATDPNRKALPDEIDRQAQHGRPTTWTTRSSPVTSTSTSPEPACSRQR